jgi:hypothetical protein
MAYRKGVIDARGNFRVAVVHRENVIVMPWRVPTTPRRKRNMRSCQVIEFTRLDRRDGEHEHRPQV